MVPTVAAGESSVILTAPPLCIRIETPAKGRGGCSRMTEVSPAADGAGQGVVRQQQQVQPCIIRRTQTQHTIPVVLHELVKPDFGFRGTCSSRVRRHPGLKLKMPPPWLYKTTEAAGVRTYRWRCRSTPGFRLAVGESSVIRLHPPLPVVGVSIRTQRGRHQHDRTLAVGSVSPESRLL